MLVKTNHYEGQLAYTYIIIIKEQMILSPY